MPPKAIKSFKGVALAVQAQIEFSRRRYGPEEDPNNPYADPSSESSDDEDEALKIAEPLPKGGYFLFRNYWIIDILAL